MATAHQKVYPSWSSGLHPGDARLIQHTQVYKHNSPLTKKKKEEEKKKKHNSPHKQNQRQKPHDYLNRCKEGLPQNSTALHAKNSQ